MAAVLVLAVVGWFLVPLPVGMSTQGWHMLIIFVSTILSLMIEVTSIPGVVFLSMLAGALTGTINIKTEAFSGFAHMVPWFLFLVLAMSKCITNTTIGLRIAYFFMRLFGRNMIGLAYSLSISEVVLASILPSNTARSASVGVPLVSSLSKYIGESSSKTSKNLIGRYLSLVYTQTNAVCSCLFITGMISNAVICDVAHKNGIEMTWFKWIGFTFIPCFIIIMIIPIVNYFTCSPRINKLSDLQTLASEKSKELGPFSRNEKITVGMFLIMLTMWIFAGFLGIEVMTTTLLGLCVFTMTGVISFKDVLSDQKNWNSVIMLGVLFSYVSLLSSSGVIDWFNNNISGVMNNVPANMQLTVLTVVYFFTHYFFSGEGTRILALFPSFYGIGLGLGLDKFNLLMTMAAFSAVSDMLTHYTSPMVITIFNLGYSSITRWIAAGSVMALISMLVFLVFA